MSELSEKLKEPFDPKVIHWRVGARTEDKSKGIALAYLNGRDVMKRLDDVCGVEGWQDRYPYVGCCEIGIKINNEWLWKSDGAGETAIEGEKGQFSDAFKRAAVKWGIGRYLYYLPNEWVPLKDGKKLAITPKLPSWAYPNNRYSKEQKAKFDILINGEPLDLWLYLQSFKNETKVGLYNSFNKGEISAMKNKVHDMESKGSLIYSELKSALVDYIDRADSGGVNEIALELGETGKELALHQLTAEQQKVFEELMG